MTSPPVLLGTIDFSTRHCMFHGRQRSNHASLRSWGSMKFGNKKNWEKPYPPSKTNIAGWNIAMFNARKSMQINSPNGRKPLGQVPGILTPMTGKMVHSHHHQTNIWIILLEEQHTIFSSRKYIFNLGSIFQPAMWQNTGVYPPSKTTPWL